MPLYVVPFGQAALCHRHQLLAHEVGEAAGDTVLRGLERDALPPVDDVGRLGGKQLVHPDGEGVDVGQRGDVGRRPLQHGHVCGTRIGECGNESHRCGAASDDDDPFAGVVEVFRPVLRMHDRALEVVGSGKLRRVALVVVVVAAAGEQERAGDVLLLTVGLDAHRPPVVRVGPVDALHVVPITDVLAEPVLADGLVEIADDRGPVGDRLGIRPRLEPEAEGEHVGVRPDARILEQVPGAAEILPAFQDDEGRGRTPLLEVPGGTDAGDARAHDHDIEMTLRVRARRLVHEPRLCLMSRGSRRRSVCVRVPPG